VTSVERTAYRVFPRLMMTRELYFYSPSQEEMAWSREKTDTDEHLLALRWARAWPRCMPRRVRRSHIGCWYGAGRGWRTRRASIDATRTPGNRYQPARTARS
jgi:hypothetical protein